MLHLQSSEVRAAVTLACGLAFVAMLATFGVEMHWLASVALATAFTCRRVARCGSILRNVKDAESWMAMTDGGRYAVVTGASSGIGIEVAGELAARGFNLVIVGRSCDRLRAASALIQRAKSRRAATAQEVRIIHEVVDLSDFAAVRDLAQRLATLPVCLMVNNAGELCRHMERNASGVERMLATNALGAMLLTELLLPALETASDGMRRCARPRVVNVSSCAHTIARKGALSDVLALCSTDSTKDFTCFNFVYYYGLSKLCMLWWTQDLAKRLEKRKSPIIVVACHPGIVASRLYRALLPQWLIRLVYLPSLLVGKTHSEGAAAPLACCLLPSLASGSYILSDGDHGCSSQQCWLSREAVDAASREAFMHWARKTVHLKAP